MTDIGPPQPAVYIPHGGGPWPWMNDPDDRWTDLGHALAALPDELPRRPRALVVVSAHWEAPRFTVATSTAPGMIYDYGGFPEYTYSVTYPAPGDPDLARRVIDLAVGAGIDADGDDTRGFDHGVFVPLAVAFPRANVPVVAVSLRAGLDPAEHLAFGRALAPLRDDNVLIIGSGLSPHDLSFRVTRDQTSSFHAWLDETLSLGVDDRDARLAAWQAAPAARACHPREEHLLPLMIAAGAGGGDAVRRICDVNMLGLPATGYRVGDE